MSENKSERRLIEVKLLDRSGWVQAKFSPNKLGKFPNQNYRSKVFKEMNDFLRTANDRNWFLTSDFGWLVRCRFRRPIENDYGLWLWVPVDESHTADTSFYTSKQTQ